MKQTGWNISILAGGPCPDNSGMIMTYLFVKSSPILGICKTDLLSRSHTGKSKDGDSLEKFMGRKAYDEHLLRPFETFLHSCFCE